MFALDRAGRHADLGGAQPIATEAERALHRRVHRRRASCARRTSRQRDQRARRYYCQETEAWVEHLTEGPEGGKIAIFYQDDAFGRAGLAGVKKAMEQAQDGARRRGRPMSATPSR